jgi:UDP-N-acetylglucosamine 4,6-dehydratase
MTRFNISLTDGVKMVLHALESAWGGEIFVPKIPSYRITDLAQAIGPDCEHPVIGIRPGEKINEEMITGSDSFTTYDLGTYYVILPQAPNWDTQDYIKYFNARLVNPGFSYDSGTNKEFLNVEELEKLIIEQVKA